MHFSSGIWVPFSAFLKNNICQEIILPVILSITFYRFQRRWILSMSNKCFLLIFRSPNQTTSCLQWIFIIKVLAKIRRNRVLFKYMLMLVQVDKDGKDLLSSIAYLLSTFVIILHFEIMLRYSIAIKYVLPTFIFQYLPSFHLPTNIFSLLFRNCSVSEWLWRSTEWSSGECSAR